MNPNKLFEELKNSTKNSPFDEKEIKRLINNKSLINKRNIIMGTTFLAGIILILALFGGNEKPDISKELVNEKTLAVKTYEIGLQENRIELNTKTESNKQNITTLKNINNSNVKKDDNFSTDSVITLEDGTIIVLGSSGKKNNTKNNYKNPNPEGNYKNMGDLVEVITNDKGENLSPFNFGEVKEVRSYTFNTKSNTSSEKFVLKPVYGKNISKLKIPTLDANALRKIGIEITDSSFVWANSYQTQINKFEYKRDKRYRLSRENRLLVDAGYPIGKKINVKENIELLFNPYFEKMRENKKGGYSSKEYIESMIYRDFDYRKHAKAYKVEYGTEDSRLEPVFVEYQIGNQFGYLLGDNGQNYSFGTPLEDILLEYDYKLVPIKYTESNFGKLKDITFWFSPSEELLEKLQDNYSQIIINELNNNCENNDVSILQSCNYNPNIISFKLYPNPAYNNLKLRLDTQEKIKCEINIFDLPGNQVGTLGTHEFYGESEKEFVINGLKPGLYTLNLVSEKGDYLNLKFIKR